MKINDVTILNWKPLGNPPGTEWWKNVEAKPDEPLIEARIDFTLTHREYHKLLDQSRIEEIRASHKAEHIETMKTAMEDEQKRIRIAELCPDLWKERGFKWSASGFLASAELMQSIDPLRDLNVMHEAERQCITTGLLRSRYQEKLSEVAWDDDKRSGSFYIINATAAQRAEAFLRTMDSK